MIDKNHNELVFLCSMPRSGSTVLSMILGSHARVLSPPEPWTLLYIADLMGYERLQRVPYGQDSALYACAQFLDRVVASKDETWLNGFFAKLMCAYSSGGDRHDAIRSLVTELYDSCLGFHDKQIFVDKTPRNYHVLDLIDELFPKAKKIFLKRNPLDIAASYKSTWGIPIEELVGEPLTENTYDFCYGLFKLEEYFSGSSADKYVLAYEDLVVDPHTTLVRLCEFLGIEFQPKIIEFYQRAESTLTYATSIVGDPRASNRPGALDINSIGKWKATLTIEDNKRLMEMLGENIFERLGYGDSAYEVSKINVGSPGDRGADHRARVLHLLRQKCQEEPAQPQGPARILRALHAIHHDRKSLADTNRDLALNCQAIDVDRAHLRLANQRLAAEYSALESDNAAKMDCIERLGVDLATSENEKELLRQEQQRLEATTEKLKSERDVLEETTEKLKSARDVQETKLTAKNEVIKSFAARELERKALLAGTADLALSWRRKHVPPGYGAFFPSVQQKGLHIGIDALEIVIGVSGGVETYMKMLVSALLESGHRVTLICLPDQLAAFRRQFSERASYFVVRASWAIRAAIKGANSLHRRKKRLSSATSMASFARLKEDLGIDILHSPVQIFSNLDFRVPAVLNLHDLQHLHFPENFRPSDIEARNYLYGLSASLADAIIVSSDFVRKDLISRMKVPSSKVFTVPVTWNPLIETSLKRFSADDAKRRYGLPQHYVLYPAQFWPHKNHVRLIEALRIVRDRSQRLDIRLVLTGYRGHSGWPMVDQAITRCGLANSVLCLDYVPVEHLAGLYKGSLFCVMPSTFEASSYPVIEAQMLGVPAMCSDVTSLPELMRDGAGLLFDPFSPEDIAEKMLRWIEDPADRDAHAVRALQKVHRDHSLQNYIEGIAKVYRRVTSEPY